MTKKKWPEEIYQRVSIPDLILVSLLSLEASGKKISFEELLKQCLDLFPRRFSFSKMKWPDARKIDRPLRMLRVQNLIGNGSETVLVLTNKGKKKALGAMNLLRQKKLKLR